jgi:multidrug resistance efflux pump
MMKGPVIRWIALIVVLVGIAGIVAFFELPRVLSQVNSETAVSSYQTARAQKGALTTISAAQTQVAVAQAFLDQVRIKTPFAGTVTVVNCEAGDQVTPAAVALQTDGLSRPYVDLSELDIPQVRIGLPVTLTLDALPGNLYQGKVSDMAIDHKSG